MPPAARGGGARGVAQRGSGAHAAGRGVTSTDIACLVHAYLSSHGFHAATAAFESDAQELLTPVLVRHGAAETSTAGGGGVAVTALTAPWGDPLCRHSPVCLTHACSHPFRQARRRQ